VLTVYPAESWAPRVRAHQYYYYRAKRSVARYFPAFSRVLEEWLAVWLVGESCLASRVCLSAASAEGARVETSQAPRSYSAKWYGAPVVSKFAALNRARRSRC